jgi:hypothetical protein
MSKTISQLPIASTVASADVFPLDQGGLTKQATLTVLAAGLPSATGTGGLVRQSDSTFIGSTLRFNGTSGVGGFTGLSTRCLDASDTTSKIVFLDFQNETGQNVTSIWSGLETDGSTYLQIRTTPAGSRSTDRRVERVRITGGGNVGIGTNTPTERLSVAGNIRVENSGGGVFFTDTAGGTPYMVGAVDGNFYFTTKNSAGVDRGVFQIAMRSDTSPLQVTAPLQIGASGSPIKSVISTIISSYAPAAIAANGGSQFLDVTLTGASSACACIVSPTSGPITSGVIVKAEVFNTNLVRIIWVNTTTSSVTLPSSNYRIVAFAF